MRLRILIASIFVLSSTIGCNNRPQDPSNSGHQVKSQTRSELMLKTSSPQETLTWFYGDAKRPEPTPEDHRVKSIKDVRVEVMDRSSRIVCVYDCDLITCDIHADFSSKGLDPPDSRYSISMNGVLCNLDSAVETAKELCSAFEIDDNRIVNWYESKAYHDVLKQNVLQVGRTEECDVSVELRTSFNQELPWFVVCSISFN